AAELCDALRDIDPAAETWHPFTVDRVAAVWPRRQAHETAMHRWDAEHAVGRDATIDAQLASDGIDEYFELAIPRLVVRTGLRLPEGSLHVHCTDVDGEWLVWNEGGDYHMIRAHQKGDAALRGPAELLLLRLWGRADARASDLDRVGDGDVLAGWLSIAGM
ncbi:MAG: maleylpyruvate isomerase family mycothiol-dependent enzyme, partial [Ilumatobacter sp.]|nr:maleylpyruvate isomerase family mycothiol-dependent enzyme [Ilumatobacter sp.]